jgi:hypothetical protein
MGLLYLTIKIVSQSITTIAVIDWRIHALSIVLNRNIILETYRPIEMIHGFAQL